VDDPAGARLRIDKWLWAARFFKTRTLAAEAVDGGKVHLNGNRAKPAKEIRAGDRIELTIGEYRWEIFVRAVAARRGPAPEARLLYEETESSRTARERQAEERRLRGPAPEGIRGRPTKRDRRQIIRFKSAS
jgi:ribosome-associated heat shock protein Hsp15